MGYQDVYNKIVNTLMGRPNGEEILPEKHQDYALSLLNYVREIESATTSSLVGVAETHTIPIQPNTLPSMRVHRVCLKRKRWMPPTANARCGYFQVSV